MVLPRLNASAGDARAPTLRTTGMLVLLVCVAIPVLVHATILERRYVFDKLDEYWRTTLGVDAPNPDWFAALTGDDRDAVVPIPDATGVFDDLPFDGVLIGEDDAGGAQTLQGFPVIPIPREHAARLYKRLAQLELYVSRYKYFAPTSSDTAEKLDLLRRRHSSAALEMYLSYLAMYFAESTFEKKCQRLRRAREIARLSLDNVNEQALLDAWRPLYALYEAGRAKFAQDLVKEVVCTIEPLRTRGEMERVITSRVEVLIARQVERKIEETLVLLNKASAEFQELVNDMDVTIKTADILELERVLGNVRANLLMVKSDQLQAAELIDALKRVDLSQLDQPADLEEFQQADASMQEMAAVIVDVLESVSEVGGVSSDPVIAEQLTLCDDLEAPYRDIDFSQNTAALEASIVGPYEDCLAQVESLVGQFRQPSAYKAFMAELSRHVRHLSQAVLQGVN